MTFPTTLDNYFQTYGELLAAQAATACAPLHVPERDGVSDVKLLRAPYAAQGHVIAAGIKALDRQRSVTLSATCGTGKSLLSMGIIHGRENGAPYRAIVFVPPHLKAKWERELRMTVPDAQVVHINSYRDLTMARRWMKPNKPSWWIVTNTRAKMGAKWRPVAKIVKYKRHHGWLRCVHCHALLTKPDKDNPGSFMPMEWSELQKKKLACESCGEQLWTWTHELDRWPVATMVHKRLKGFFGYCVIDESHQAKAADTAIGNAEGSLAAACGKVIKLTGTLAGGFAWHLRAGMFRCSPASLIREGLTWGGESAFNERYGRMEKKITEIEKRGGKDNQQSRGSTTRTVKYVRPGIMPTLFGRHMMANTIFLSLEDISEALPSLTESIVPVDLDVEQEWAYRMVESALVDAIKLLMRKKNKTLLSRMLHTLLGYADHPYGWGDIGYWDQSEDGCEPKWVHVVTPPDLDANKIRPKERALIDFVKAEKAAGRQCWVYCVMTGARDVNARLEKLLTDARLRVKVLRSEVETGDREEWIAKHAPGCDVIVSHPQLVETGLDLFADHHNFSTLIFYSTGYNLFTMRQASRRSYRLGQTLPCKVTYFHYANTMQARAMSLMGKKLIAAESIEGKFSTEGLAALAGDEGSIETALAASLVKRLDDLDVGRTWAKLTANGARQSSSPPVTPQVTPRVEAAVTWPVSPVVRKQSLLF